MFSPSLIWPIPRPTIRMADADAKVVFDTLPAGAPVTIVG